MVNLRENNLEVIKQGWWLYSDDISFARRRQWSFKRGKNG